jgi:hypothetical protein
MRLAASTVQSCKFFESTLPEELFELKNEETLKKSENLRDICTSQDLFITTMHGPIQSREIVPLQENFLQTYVVGFRVAGTIAPNGWFECDWPPVAC